MKRRNLLKLALSNFVVIFTSPSRLWALTGAHMRRARVSLLGPLRTTQAVFMVTGRNPSQHLRTTQTVMMVAGRNSSQNLRTTHAMMIVIGK